MPEHALYYQESRAIKPFTLADHHGNNFSNEQLLTKWSFVFFGYTSCPDVCPTSLQNLNFIYEELLAIDHNSQVLLVTVDPKRDSQHKLSQYINYFNQSFIALRAEHDRLFPFARNLGMMYAITQDKASQHTHESTDNHQNNYLVDHSASIALINPEGRIAAIFRAEQVIGEVPSINTEQLLSDYKKIVALY